jgi:hypothetical protein
MKSDKLTVSSTQLNSRTGVMQSVIEIAEGSESSQFNNLSNKLPKLMLALKAPTHPFGSVST